MAFLRKLVLWLCVIVGVSLATLVWRPLAGRGTWLSQIDHGELVLVAIGVSASAVGYSAMAPTLPGQENIRAGVISFGILSLALSMLVYAAFSDGPQAVAGDGRPTALYISRVSYVFFVASLITGAASTLLLHRAETGATP